jgi:hypothetical protein
MMRGGANSTKAEVFIIESLKFEEEQDYREGQMIAQALRMSLKEPQYRYVRTKTELAHFVDEFEDSGYRYLHISCHGSHTGVSMTLDDLMIAEFADIVGPVLDRKRLFLSTCQASTARMAEAVFAKGGCMSLAGPANLMNFDDSVVLWTAFYHLMFKADANRMKRLQIEATLSSLAKLLGEQVNFHSAKNGKIDRSRILPHKHELLRNNPMRGHDFHSP